MRSTKGAALLAAVVVLLPACEDVTGSLGGARGTYDLAEANGEALPTVIYDGPYQVGSVTFDAVVTATAGTLVLRDDTFEETLEYALVLDGNSFPPDEVTISGDYSVQGVLYTFDPGAAGVPSFTGTLQGSTLTTVETSPDFGTTTYTWVR